MRSGVHKTRDGHRVRMYVREGWLTVRLPDRASAEALYRQAHTSPPDGYDPVSVKEAIERWVETMRHTSAHNQKVRMYRLRAAIGSYYPHGWAGFSPDGIRERLAEKKYAPNTYNAVLDAANSFFNFCINRGYTPSTFRNPCAEIRRRRPQRVLEYRALTQDELNRLLKVVRDGGNPFHYLAVVLAAYTGIRWAEMKRLHWRDVDIEGNPPILAIPEDTAKTVGGTIPLLPVVVDALEGARNKYTLSGDVLVPGELDNRQFKKYAREAGIEIVNSNGRVGRKSLRVTFATMIARENIPVHLATKLMRHSSPEVTSRHYVQPTADMLAEEMDSLKKYTEIPEDTSSVLDITV